MESNTSVVRKGSNQKKFLLLVPIVFIALAIVIVPHIDLKGVRTQIAEEASLRLDGEVVISRASLVLVPVPHFTLRGLRMESPRWGGGTVAAVRIYPRLLPLIKKKISVKRLVVRGAVLDLVLRQRIVERGEDVFAYVEQQVMRIIPFVKLEGGRIHIVRPGEQEPFVTLHDVRGTITSTQAGEVRSELRFACPGAETIELRVSVGETEEGEASYSLLAAGTGVTIEEVKGVALEALGTNETVHRVFQIFQGGEFSHIVFHGEGRDFEEALDFEHNVRIRGTLVEGKIVTPPGPLPLEEASGEFEIEEAVLRCWDAKARLGKSTASEGALVVGLISGQEDFHLDAVVDADAEDLAHYLPLVIKEEGLKKEIESFREAKGRGKGRLVLGGDINHIRPQVEVERFQCSFRHANSPGRISLDGGQIALHNGKSVWQADTVTWKDFHWKNAEGTVIFGDRGIEITVANADLCGIHSNGIVYTGGGRITYSFQFRAEEADLSSTILCLWGKDARIEGPFDLDGTMWAEGTQDPLREASEGSLVFSSKQGRIYRWTILSQISGMLNVIGLVTGRFPDFTQKGFEYDTFIISGELRDGYIYLDEAIIDGPAMKIVGQGKFDLAKGEADIAVLVAPLKTVDTVMKNIPIVGKIITGKDGTFISIPFRVKGPLDDSTITLLPPEAVGSGLWGVLKRTLQAPVDAVKTVISKK